MKKIVMLFMYAISSVFADTVICPSDSGVSKHANVDEFVEDTQTVLFSFKGRKDISCTIVGKGDMGTAFEAVGKEDKRVVNLPLTSQSFPGESTVKPLHNDKDVHTGYHEMIKIYKNGELKNILNIYYNLDSEPVGGKYVIVNRSRIELDCKFKN